jgi:hypothetical protein
MLCSSTQLPIGIIVPFFSAIGMNFAGLIIFPSPSFQRINASIPRSF